MPNYTDWNQYLAHKDDVPEQDQMAPLPDPMATFQMPTDPSIRPEQIGKAIEFMYNLRKHQQASREAAVRWQGMQDFNRLRTQFETQGLPADEAVRRAYGASAPKIHYSDPAGFERSMTILGRRPTVRQPSMAQTPVEAGRGKLLFENIRNAGMALRKAETEWNRQGGFLGIEVPEAITKARDQSQTELDQARKDYQDHLEAIQSRLEGPGPMPGAPAGIPVPPTRTSSPVPGLTINPATALPASRAAAGKKGKLTDAAKAKAYLQAAKGDKALARKLAQNDGWDL